MTDSEKIAARIEQLTARHRNRAIRLRRVCIIVCRRPWALVLALLLILILGWAMTWVSIPFPGENSNPLLTALWNTSVKLAVMLMVFLFTFAFFSAPPKEALQYEAELAHIGFVDRYKNPPALVSKERINPPKIEKLTFYSAGISLESWIERQGDIQDALNAVYVEPPQYAYKKRYYIMLTVLPGTGEPRKENLYDDEL